MAAIDFPASPVDGQLFPAPNGILYQWKATPGAWVAANQVSQLQRGNFFASGSAGPVQTTDTVFQFPTVLNGNEGGFFNPANGRFTPPAGRYNIFAGLNWYSSSMALPAAFKLRKNGVVITPAPGEIFASSVATNQGVELTLQQTVDANGTDYFDIVGRTAAGTTTPSSGMLWFGAFPVNVILAIPPTGGDVFATGSGATGTSPTTILFTPQVGNSGNWYNPANGRYTPPAGRYYLATGFTFFSGASLIIGSIKFRKNGVDIVPTITSTGPAANNQGNSTSSVLVDANGTDWFDVQAWTHVGGSALSYFNAFPISGLQGPPGPPGPPAQLGFRLLSRQVLAVAAADLNYQNIPSDINDLEIGFDITPVNSAVDLVLQFYDGAGTLINANGQYGWSITAANNSLGLGAAPAVSNNVSSGITNGIGLNYSGTGSRVGNTTGIRGSIKINDIKNASRFKSADHQTNYVNDGGTALLPCTGGGWRGGSVMAVTGLRLVFGSGNIAIGSTMSVWGSP